MSNTVETKPEQKFETMKCFQCLHWKPMVQPCETPEETYESIIREKNAWGKLLGACTVFGGAYPMFDIEECKLKEEHKHLAEHVERF
ncbi:hypothetical protein CVD28_00930 [Bacillus sp. M6-12]|uniref:hypothetical protein n=1 Tax=Bacillus sp. M6-12 TaxID=2054166 RepID=UPI000C75FB46|nr:hypothetical protein [Bacillus sp. M6-12]PLS18997.1 hypothetical protein CVD28_00930 [Bacillus sp. M6-12]